MLVRDTLTEAIALRPRAGAVGLVLSLEGAAYYVFHSYQTRDQLASSNLRGKIELHDELLGRNETAQQKQNRYTNLIDHARNMAATTAVGPEGRHAEEVMIENWGGCTADFMNRRGRFPSKAEVFLTYCPCQPANAQPSPVRTIHNIIYPLSCAAKLQTFCTTGDRIGMNWKVYFDHPFGGVPGLNYNVGNLTIGPLPDYIVLP